MKIIKLYSGEVVLVDDEDYDRLVGIQWYIHTQGYASGRVRLNNKLTMVLMHRYILNTPDGYGTDHIDGNKLNNQKANLRMCTQKMNMRNAVYQNATGYTGVKLRKNGRYQARISISGKQLSLGTFDTAEEAYLKYMETASMLLDFARRNVNA